MIQVWIAIEEDPGLGVNNEVRDFNKGNRVQVPVKMKVVA